jgi:putative phosphoesterase
MAKQKFGGQSVTVPVGSSGRAVKAVGPGGTDGERTPESLYEAVHNWMVRMVMIADTHVPRRAADLPPRIWEEVDAADVVVHAGDWTDATLVDRLDARAACLVACYGNNDGPDVRARVPEVARATIGGLRIVVVHETGPSTGRERRVAATYPDCDVVVFGHSHIPWDSQIERPDGSGTLRLLNPGSPTDRRRQPHHTYLTAEITADARLLDVTLHRL